MHNLRVQKIPECIVKWMKSFLSERSTRLQFNRAKSDSIRTPAGVPQGSPISPLLYMYYNTDLLDITENRDSAVSLGFVDDIVYGVEGASDRGNARKINEILRRVKEWRRKHGVQFETSKYVLVHYTRNRNKATKAAVNTNSTRIQPSEEAKYLGIIFDKQLRFKSHIAQTICKGIAAAIALSGIARCK